MSWYCDRCGEKQSTFSSAKWNSKDTISMKEHDIPSYINICGSCGFYLFPYQNTWWERLKVDADYLKEPDSEFYKKSRFYKASRNFDIEYNLLNSETNLYWDEDYDEIIDFAEHYEELNEKFTCPYDNFDDENDVDEDDIEEENDSPQFSDNADVILQKGLFSKSTCAAYKSLIESVNNSYQTRFVSDFQTYVTRLGLIINTIVENKNFYGKNHYPELLKYICKDILDNDYLYKNLIRINSHANDVKHSTKDINVDIKDYLIYYNSMIDKLKELSCCNSFEKCHICHKHPNSKNQIKRESQKEIICHCCGRVNPKEYYRCPKCKKLTCDKCYNREKRMCEDCEKQ